MIYKFLGSLFDKIKGEEDKHIVMSDSAQMFWWICQAKFWDLGDPSIAEIIMRTTWQVKGLENLPWKVGIIPWVEAMKCKTAEEFAATLPSLLDR